MFKLFILLPYGNGRKRLMKIALIDGRMPNDAKSKLLSLGFHIIETRGASGLSDALSHHPDMLIFKDGNTLISSASYAEEAPFIFDDLSRICKGLRMIFTADMFSDKYPHDSIFNALVIGNKIFLKSDTVSNAILNYAKERELKLIKVKQGYPACTVLPLGDNAAITADRGMARAMKDEGINVSLIEEGHISLPPHEYGFIGGASGVFRDKVYFIGDYKKHPSHDIIETACLHAGLSPVSLSSSPLSDLGRILFFDDGV